MKAHKLKDGDIIYDLYDGRWGVVNGDYDLAKEDDDVVVRYEPCDINDYGDVLWTCGDAETQAKDAYPFVKGAYFWGKVVCKEINEYEDDHEFYSPYWGGGVEL